MNRTYTPELPPTSSTGSRYAALFRDDFNRPRQAAWCGVYLRGLLQDGDRKSIEPMAARVPLPPDARRHDPDQALQQFLSQSTWDEQAVLKRYRAAMAAIRQPRGDLRHRRHRLPQAGQALRRRAAAVLRALGKKANCQVAVTVHYVAPKGHYPLDMRLYLPESWLADRTARQGRRARASTAGADQGPDRPGVARPGPRRGAAGRVVVADSGYGVSRPFRDGLASGACTTSSG